MSNFIFERDNDLEGVVLIAPFHAEDKRGAFVKIYERNIFNDNGVDFQVHEEFVTYSKRNTIRGLHFQTVKPQAKLVSALAGEVYDVVVDLRLGSPTFGKWKGFTISAANRLALLIPKGFAHGFMATEENSAVLYKCDAPFLKEYDSGIVWNDRDIGIDWPLNGVTPIVSGKDAGLASLNEFRQAIGGFSV